MWQHDRTMQTGIGIFGDHITRLLLRLFKVSLSLIGRGEFPDVYRRKS
jgi:hypothetical protein